jgi:hypothetical protein
VLAEFNFPFSATSRHELHAGMPYFNADCNALTKNKQPVKELYFAQENVCKSADYEGLTERLPTVGLEPTRHFGH